jgi:hypothetical protein
MNNSKLLKEKADILDRFDFGKVQDYMKATGWTWHGSPETPTIIDLMSTANMLLDNVIQSAEPASNSGTGGFTAYKMPWGLSLHFSVEYKTYY